MLGRKDLKGKWFILAHVFRGFSLWFLGLMNLSKILWLQLHVFRRVVPVIENRKKEHPGRGQYSPSEFSLQLKPTSLSSPCLNNATVEKVRVFKIQSLSLTPPVSSQVPSTSACEVHIYATYSIRGTLVHPPKWLLFPI